MTKLAVRCLAMTSFAGCACPRLVEVYGLLLGHPVETEVVEDEQVRGEEGAEGLVRGVVHPGLSHGLLKKSSACTKRTGPMPGSDGLHIRGLPER